ncbi:ankyrin repeat domain-containing protein 39 [Thalassophryne amazonica]|uniref:ankyrin repeat domain-containing protein 39 n=1 Tax=Thalassophryne amazonica TaxID=390379 RepID=UPI001472464F|nr:ankyrin repeat domain-containing protein 39 [Thalassophryne amazonica]
MLDYFNIMASDQRHCLCCTHSPVSSNVCQTLDEMDFERGIWSAAKDGDLDRVMLLVHKGTDPNLRDSAGFTALHYASRGGHAAVCKFLLENGACASPRTPGGATPLHRSSYCGHLEVVGLLLDHRADPLLCDDGGASPLHKAAEQGHENVCQLLVDRCPALRCQKNKKLLLPYQLAPQGALQELLKPPS